MRDIATVTDNPFVLSFDHTDFTLVLMDHLQPSIASDMQRIR